MRRLCLACAALVTLASCSGGDDTAPLETSAPTTTVAVPDGSDRCETTPDPADYPADGLPTVRRPCDVPTDLVKQVIREGSGRALEAGDGIIFHSSSVRSVDGSFIASTWASGSPNNIPVIGRGGAIPGLDEGLIGVHPGDVVRLDIPGDQAYGDSPPGGDAGVLEPNDPLTYVIEVLAVIPPLTAENAPTDISVPPSIGATELGIDDLVVGDGKVVEEGDTVVLSMLLVRGDNEVVLFNSWDQGTPLLITLQPELMEGPEPVTLPGIFQGVQGARVGGRRVLNLPPELAWGEDGLPTLGLPPNTDLIVIADILGAY
jgi:peptidylprolyl isomerase